MVAVSRGLENIEINYTEPTHPHTHVSENFMPHEDENADHIADTFANCSDEGSEPDEVEFPIPPENGPNDVDINVIAEEFARGQVKCNPTFAIKHVIQAVKDHTGYDIPYQKTWYSLKMAREIVYGTWESSVQKLPKYMGAVQKYNPGTIVEWKHKALHPTGAYVIGYVFWAFKPCIEGFKFCRNIISVDGTHLYTRYKHKMLIAATMDGNQQDLCWRAGSEYQIRKFNRIMEEIKGQKLEAFTFLDRINKEKWTASHDGGWRCGILTTNMSECINGVLKGARRLPVTAIVEITLQRTAHYFRERALRSAVMLSNGQLWTDFAKKKFTDWGEKSITHTVTKYDHLQQSARSLQNANKDLDSTPMLSNLLTENVHAANGINLSEEYWDVPNFELVHDTTIRTSTRPGRSQTSRIQNEIDWRQTRARQQAQRRGESSRQSNVIEQDYPQ
ncbi:UNVERIFIED_CONTAM: hypothetical protein Sradi_0774300 [Sesamum radiatum]|uniref:Transposase n=1 Tax=Sesamum radiatum TaxID=300843 RepID=A0AAW2VQ86_SESRA